VATLTPAGMVDLIYGVSPVVEQTGGGCTALVAELEGGFTFVLCSNLSAPSWGDEGTSAAIYAPGDWHGDGQPPALREAWTEEPLSPEVLNQLLLDAL
jgi:hypothetical protein